MLPRRHWGSGPEPALFLHGFTGDRESFSHLEPLLGEALSATCVDVPGHGAAPLPTTVEAFLEELASDALPPGTTVVGYSQGARLALALALRFPERVRRLVLESGSGGVFGERRRAARRASDAALATVLRRDGIEAFVERWERVPILDGLRSLPAPRMDELRARRLAQRPEGLARALEVFGQGAMPATWSSLAALRSQVLLITGSRDTRYTSIARRMARRITGAEHVAIRGVGHTPHLEAPDRYARVVREFLTRSAP
jgi:2-succinyl-6-hydroxy-2,4-cyclohexadiene-1-carboxylate synthase